MSRHNNPGTYSDRSSRNFGGGHNYTLRHPGDRRRFRLWYLVPIAGVIGLIWWGLS